MNPIKANLNTWPRRKNGEPIFRTTNDAIFYAQLASRKESLVTELHEYRAKAYRDLANQRTKKNPNLDNLMEYAVKAQMFRECYEEIERINGEDKG